MAKTSIVLRTKNPTHGQHSLKTGPEREAPMSSNSESTPSPDLVFENHFSIFLIRPVSPTGQSWLDENVGDENTLTFGGAIVCEPRYVEAIMLGAVDAGLAVQS